MALLSLLGSEMFEAWRDMGMGWGKGVGGRLKRLGWVGKGYLRFESWTLGKAGLLRLERLTHNVESGLRRLTLTRGYIPEQTDASHIGDIHEGVVT